MSDLEHSNHNAIPGNSDDQVSSISGNSTSPQAQVQESLLGMIQASAIRGIVSRIEGAKHTSLTTGDIQTLIEQGIIEHSTDEAHHRSEDFKRKIEQLERKASDLWPRIVDAIAEIPKLERQEKTLMAKIGSLVGTAGARERDLQLLKCRQLREDGSKEHKDYKKQIGELTEQAPPKTFRHNGTVYQFTDHGSQFLTKTPRTTEVSQNGTLSLADASFSSRSLGIDENESGHDVEEIDKIEDETRIREIAEHLLSEDPEAVPQALAHWEEIDSSEHSRVIALAFEIKTDNATSFLTDILLNEGDLSDLNEYYLASKFCDTADKQSDKLVVEKLIEYLGRLNFDPPLFERVLDTILKPEYADLVLDKAKDIFESCTDEDADIADAYFSQTRLVRFIAESVHPKATAALIDINSLDTSEYSMEIDTEVIIALCNRIQEDRTEKVVQAEAVVGAEPDPETETEADTENEVESTIEELLVEAYVDIASFKTRQYVIDTFAKNDVTENSLKEIFANETSVSLKVAILDVMVEKGMFQGAVESYYNEILNSNAMNAVYLERLCRKICTGPLSKDKEEALRFLVKNTNPENLDVQQIQKIALDYISTNVL